MKKKLLELQAEQERNARRVAEWKRKENMLPGNQRQKRRALDK